MKKPLRTVLFGLVILTTLLSACATASTPLPPTSTPLPTSTIKPTETPSPTYTPIPPTATAKPPEKSLEYLSDVNVVFSEAFEKHQ